MDEVRFGIIGLGNMGTSYLKMFADGKINDGRVSGRNKSLTVSTVKKICDGIDIPIGDFFASDLFGDLEQEIK